MDIFEKAKILGQAGQYDSCGPKSCEININRGLNSIYYAKAEHKECRFFKTLMTNSCSFDCKYCINSKGCSKKKAMFKPDELASLFDHFRRNLDVNGLFLSSGIAGNSDKMTEKMIKTVKLLRLKYKFEGYIHFKILPGTSYELIKQASELVDRMSINIEAPNKNVLNELSSNKDYRIDILRRQAWISKLKLDGGQTTQLIVNKLSTDKDILKMVDWEYDKLNLIRIYFSAFRPVKGTILENEKPESVLRQNHLYNVDFLVRRYNYNFREFDEIMNDCMLPSEDPKLALAKLNFDGPVDINEADYSELIRIPGIGPKTAKKIIKSKKIIKYEQLHNLGGWIKRAKPFIKINGHTQKMLNDF